MMSPAPVADICSAHKYLRAGARPERLTEGVLLISGAQAAPSAGLQAAPSSARWEARCE